MQVASLWLIPINAHDNDATTMLFKLSILAGSSGQKEDKN